MEVSGDSKIFNREIVDSQYYNFKNTITSIMSILSSPIESSEPSLNETCYLQIFSL